MGLVSSLDSKRLVEDRVASQAWECLEVLQIFQVEQHGCLGFSPGASSVNLLLTEIRVAPVVAQAELNELSVL